MKSSMKPGAQVLSSVTQGCLWKIPVMLAEMGLEELFCLQKVLTSLTNDWLSLVHDSFQACRKRQRAIAGGHYSTSELSQDPKSQPCSFTPGLTVYCWRIIGFWSLSHMAGWAVFYFLAHFASSLLLVYTKKKQSAQDMCLWNHWSIEWSQVIVRRMSFQVQSLKFSSVFTPLCMQWELNLCQSTCKYMCMHSRPCNYVI